MGHLRGFPDYLPFAGFRNCPYHDSTGRTGFPQLNSQLSPKKPTRMAILNPAAPIYPEDVHKNPPLGIRRYPRNESISHLWKKKNHRLVPLFSKTLQLKNSKSIDVRFSFPSSQLHIFPSQREETLDVGCTISPLTLQKTWPWAKLFSWREQSGQNNMAGYRLRASKRYRCRVCFSKLAPHFCY